MVSLPAQQPNVANVKTKVEQVKPLTKVHTHLYHDLDEGDDLEEGGDRDEGDDLDDDVKEVELDDNYDD